MLKLVCTQPFFDRATRRAINRGDHIFDQAEVARHSSDREKHFVRVQMSAAEVAEVEAAAARQAAADKAAKPEAEKPAA